jgi:outer membrane protein
MEELKTKYRKYRSWLWMLLALQVTVQAQETQSYTLQQCLDLAMKQNQTVLNSGYQVQSNDAFLQQARATALPSVSAYANQGISTGKSINPYTNAFINQEVGTGQYGVNANFTLFSGLSTINTIRQNALAYKAGKLDYAQAKIDISIQVLLAYLQILNSEELMNQALSQMAATQVQLDRLNTLQKYDALSPSVLHDTRGQLANDKLSLINAQGAMVTAKLNMGQLINVTLAPETKFEKIDTSVELLAPATEANAYDGISQAMPAVKASGLRTISTLKRVHATRGNLFPVLSLNGSLGSNYSSAALSQRLMNSYDEATGAYVNSGGTLLPVYESRNIYQSDKIGFNDQVTNNFNTYVGLSLQVPLFNGLRNKTQVEQAKVAHLQAAVQEKSTEVRYKALVAQLINDLKNAYERYGVSLQQTGDYEASFKIATIKFEKGAITTFEYTTAKNNFDKASANLISARYEYLFKGKTLELYQRAAN